MATLTDLLKKVKKTIKDYTPLDEVASSVQNYFDPKTSGTQGFWGTPIAQGLGNLQQNLEQRTLPTVNLTQYAKDIKEPVPRIGAELGLGLVENILNIPQRLLYSGARVGQDVRTVLGGGEITPQRAIGTAAEVALPLLDMYTLGRASLIKELGKKLIGQAEKEGLKSTIKRAAIGGGLFGTGYGTLSGAAEGNEAKLGNVLKNAAVGGLLGATAGGTIGGVSGILGLIKRSSQIEKELAKKAVEKVKLKVQPKIPPELEPPTTLPAGQESAKDVGKIKIKGGIEPQTAKNIRQSIVKAKAANMSFDEWVKGLGEIVFHGSKDEIKVFGGVPKGGTRFLGNGVYFTDNISRAKEFGKVTEAVVNLKNPYKQGEEFNEILKTEIRKLYGKKGASIAERIIERKEPLKATEINPNLITKLYKKAGYDGVISTGGAFGAGKGDILIFNPKNIKTIPQLKAKWDTVKVTPKVKPSAKIKIKAQPDEVGRSIEERLNAFTEKVLGYNPQDIQGGQKGASFFTRTLRKGQEAVSTTIEKGLASQFTPVRLASQLLEGFFRGIGMSPKRAEMSATLRGGINLAQERSFNIGQALYDLLGKNEESLARINAVLDPELAKTKISFNDLTPQEKQVYNLIREGLDLVHDISYASGFLSPEKYLANKGKYTPRLYEPMELPPEVNEFVKQSTRKINLDIFKKRKDVDDWKIENSLNNPVYGLAKRLSQVQINMEVKKYTNFLASNSRYVSDTPKAGFTKLLESPVYGKLSGKYVLNSAAEDLKGFFFSNELMQKLYDVFRVYDRLPPRQLQKKLLTVFNPTTNVGNIVSDNVFGFLVGVDPLTLNKNILELKRNPKEFRKLADYLMSKNIIGTDITRTDFVSQLAKVDELADIGAKQKLKDVASKVERFYGGTDDVYKTAAFKALLNKGYSLEEATRLVADGFQNYSNVGKFYDLWSKTPIIGEPFIKFQGDLIRIIKNAAINRPLHLITFLATLKGIAYLFSKLSKESDEDRITREQRYAAPYIPGLNIPLTWQTPFGEINVARYISPTFANRDTSTLIGKMLPFIPEMSKYGKDNAAFIAQNINDPFVSPLIHGLVLNRDFRGKPIADPNETKYKPSTLTDEEKLANVATFIARGYAPPPINSAIDVVRAFQGEPNMYGAKQTPEQAMARLFGVKIQKFGPEEVQQQRAKDLEFSVKHNEFIDKQINSVYKQLLNKEITQEQADKRIENLEKQKKELPNVFRSRDKIRLLDKDGKLKIIDLSFQPTPPVLTGNAELDKKAISKFNSEITKKANDIYDLYQAGEMSTQEAEQELLKLKELKELKAKTGKVKVGGKTIKIARPPTLKIKQTRGAKTKTTSLKVRIARPRSIRTLKIAKPKTQTLSIKIPKQTYQPIPIKLGSN